MMSKMALIALVGVSSIANAFIVPQSSSSCEPPAPISGSHFDFENPRTDCKYASQPFIFDLFSSFKEDSADLLRHIQPEGDYRIMGHHPFAGFYDNIGLLYVNALWRLVNCLENNVMWAEVIAIHGGCDDEWSVQEFHFNGTMKTGRPWEMSGLWVAHWTEGLMIDQVRAYPDGGAIIKTLLETETWFNSSDTVVRRELVPGPGGLPDGLNSSANEKPGLKIQLL